jgi:hypothetical protein
MRNKNEFYVGGAQRGTRVRWAKDRRSGHGTVTKVYEPKWADVEAGKVRWDDKEWDVKDDATGDIIRCNINQIRHLNVPNRIKKQRYADKHGL